MAIKLREAGFDSVLLLERAATVGGTWRDNLTILARPATSLPICTHSPSNSTRTGHVPIPVRARFMPICAGRQRSMAWRSGSASIRWWRAPRSMPAPRPGSPTRTRAACVRAI
ncbi:hypothetical protein ACU4GD_12120 [Cupriavidus basilensis]